MSRFPSSQGGGKKAWGTLRSPEPRGLEALGLKLHCGVTLPSPTRPHHLQASEM